MSGAPIEKLPASPRVSSPSVPVPDRSSEEVNVGSSDFRTGGSNQLRDPCLRSAGNDRKLSLGNGFHSGPLSDRHPLLTTRVMRRRRGNCLASFGSVCLLSRVHVEPDVVSVSVFVIQTGAVSKVGSYRRHKRYSYSVRRLAPLRTFILDSRKSPCFPVDRS
jgi:hypothetical protein